MHRKKPTVASLLLKALFPRFLFLAHGMICIWIVAVQERDKKYWGLSVCLVLLVLEGILNVLIRHGREFHWFCPSAFLYGVVLIVTMTFIREKQIRCVTKTHCSLKLEEDNPLEMMFNNVKFETQASIVEQTGMLVLIIGRWLLPQGSISREAFSQILLIYIGMAADIVEFSEIYGEDDVMNGNTLGDDRENVLHGVMAVWALSVTQFSLTIALPEEGIRDETEEDKSEDEDDGNQPSYFKAKISNKVGPISYMHYKSMLREGNATNAKRNPNDAQRAFREKYEQTSRTLQSLRIRTGTNTSAQLRAPSVSSMNSTNDRTTFSQVPPSDKLPGKPISDSNGSASPRVRLPQGDRIASSVGSPASINSFPISSPKSIRSEIKSLPPSSKSTRSNDSKKHNFSTEGNRKKVSAWRRLVENTPFSKKRVRRRPRKDSTKEDNSLGIGKKEINNCFLRYIDLIGICIPVLMQDGPFFILRFVLVAHYQIVTQMIFLLLTKNALVIIVQIYRILIMYCAEPKHEPDIDDPSVRVRTAMNTNKRLSEKRSFKSQTGSLAVQAISRMHTQILSKPDEHILQNGHQNYLQNNHTIIEMS